MTGKKLSEETRQKISNVNKGRIPYWSIGRKHTEATRLKMSISQRKRKCSEETKRKISLANKGKIRSEEVKRKLRENHPHLRGENHPFYGKHHTEETKKRLREIHKGKRYSIRTEFKKGLIPWSKGKHYSEILRQKLSLAHKGEKRSEEWKAKMSKRVQMEGNPAWRGGISFEPYSPNFTDQLKAKIRTRDNFICQKCGIPELECNERLNTHHIDYDKKNCREDNLISLCRKCNVEVNGNREYWTEFFQEKIKEKYEYTNTHRP